MGKTFTLYIATFSVLSLVLNISIIKKLKINFILSLKIWSASYGSHFAILWVNSLKDESWGPFWVSGPNSNVCVCGGGFPHNCKQLSDTNKMYENST